MKKTEDIKYIRENYFRKTKKELSDGINMTIEELLKFAKENNVDISNNAKKEYKLKYVGEHYGTFHNTEIEKHLNIGRKRLNEIAKELNIFVDPHNYSELTEKEKIDYIRENAGNKTKKEIIEYLHISSRKYDAFVKENNIEYKKTKVKNISSTVAVLNIIQKKYKRLGAEKLAAELNCSVSFVREHAKSFGLTKGSPIWSDEEDNILMDYYEELSLERLQKRLKGKGYVRTIKSIRKRLKSLHIHLLEYGLYLTTNNIRELMGFPLEKIAFIYREHLETEIFNGFRRCTIDNFENFLKECPHLWNAKTADIDSLKLLFIKTSSSKYNSNSNNYSVDWLTEKSVHDNKFEVISRREWTTLEEEKYIQLTKEGKTLDEIAILFQRTKPSLTSKGRRINIHALEGGNENVINA